jgi:hypothetical protein
MYIWQDYDYRKELADKLAIAMSMPETGGYSYPLKDFKITDDLTLLQEQWVCYWAFFTFETWAELNPILLLIGISPIEVFILRKYTKILLDRAEGTEHYKLSLFYNYFDSVLENMTTLSVCC